MRDTLRTRAVCHPSEPVEGPGTEEVPLPASSAGSSSPPRLGHSRSGEIWGPEAKTPLVSAPSTYCRSGTKLCSPLSSR